jgi:hypothetical protein
MHLQREALALAVLPDLPPCCQTSTTTVGDFSRDFSLDPKGELR